MNGEELVPQGCLSIPGMEYQTDHNVCVSHRRLRAYEALTRELQEKLDRANALLRSVGYAPIHSSASIAMTPPSPSAASVQERSGAYSGDSASTYMGSSPTASMPQPNILRVNSESQGI